MTDRKRPFSAWLRTVHRWISMAFVVTAAVLIVQSAITGLTDLTLSTVAIVLLVLLILTGAWMAVHHYVVRLRRAKRRTTVAA